MRILAISDPSPQATPEALAADMDAQVREARGEALPAWWPS